MTDEFAEHVENLPLGTLVEELVERKIEFAISEGLADRRREEMLREINQLKREMDRRETGRSVPETKGKRGIRSLTDIL